MSFFRFRGRGFAIALTTLALMSPLAQIVGGASRPLAHAAPAQTTASSFNGYWFNPSSLGSINHMQVAFIPRLINGEPTGSGSFSVDTVENCTVLGPNGKIRTTCDRGFAHSGLVNGFNVDSVSITYSSAIFTTTYTLTPVGGRMRVEIQRRSPFFHSFSTSTEYLTREAFTQTP